MPTARTEGRAEEENSVPPSCGGWWPWRSGAAPTTSATTSRFWPRPRLAHGRRSRQAAGEELDRSLPITLFFEHRTLRELAAHLQTGEPHRGDAPRDDREAVADGAPSP
ncbi:acyl carrier protein [Streptosporangium lutulentum]